MNQPCTEQTIRDNEQLAELDVMYKETERALVLIGDRMREIKNRLQKKPPVANDWNGSDIDVLAKMNDCIAATIIASEQKPFYTKLAGGKYEK